VTIIIALKCKYDLNYVIEVVKEVERTKMKVAEGVMWRTA